MLRYSPSLRVMLFGLAVLAASLSAGVRPARCQEPPMAVSWREIKPQPARPGETVSIHLSVLVNLELPESATLDLSSLGLSNALPMTRNFDDLYASFTVPTDTPPGDYPMTATVRGQYGTVVTTKATLTVSLGLRLESVAFQPSFVEPGQSTSLSVIVSPGNQSVATVTADLSAFGLSATAPLAKTGENTYAVTFTVPATMPDSYPHATATVQTADGQTFQGTAQLMVRRLYPPTGSLSLVPGSARPGQQVAMQASFMYDLCTVQSVTVDLSAFGLSGATPLTGLLGCWSGAFTVPATTPDGIYPVSMTYKDDCGHTLTGARSFAVTRGPIVTSATFESTHIPPGGTATVLATVEPGIRPTAGVTADLSAFGLSSAIPLQRNGQTNNWYATFTVPGSLALATYTAPVTARDVDGRTSTANAALFVDLEAPPVVLTFTAQPSTVHAGEAVTLTVAIERSACEVYGVIADLSPFGLPSRMLQPTTGMTRTTTFTVPAGTPPGTYRIETSVTAECGAPGLFGVLVTVPPPNKRGDLTGDGMVTMDDLAEAMRVAGGFSRLGAEALSPGDLAGGGANGRSPDGRVTLQDAVALLRALAGLEPL